MNITKNLLNIPQKKPRLDDLYRLQRGCDNIHSKTNLPYFTELYNKALNDRQRAIIGIIRYIELRGSKGFFDAKNAWLLQRMQLCGFDVTIKTVEKDLKLLTDLLIIYRNTWNLPKKAGGGRKRQICTAWGIESFKNNFLFRQRHRKKNDVKPKPAHVFERFFAYREKVKEKLKGEDKEGSIKKFSTSYKYKDLYIEKKRGFDQAKPQKSLTLHTSKEIIEYLKDPDRGKFDKIFFESKAIEEVEEELHPLLLEEIARTNEKLFDTFIQSATSLQITFKNAKATFLKCLILLYEKLKHLIKTGVLKNIRNLIAYTLKCFTVKRCTGILCKEILSISKGRVLKLLTTDEIIYFLNCPPLYFSRNTKLFICPKAQEGLTEEESKKLLDIIGRSHCRGKCWGPQPGEYLQWLCNNVLDLVKKGKIQKPKNLISYTINCHKTALLAKFMDERHERKIMKRKILL